jgi:hypothetical protein
MVGFMVVQRPMTRRSEFATSRVNLLGFIPRRFVGANDIRRAADKRAWLWRIFNIIDASHLRCFVHELGAPVHHFKDVAVVVRHVAEIATNDHVSGRARHEEDTAIKQRAAGSQGREIISHSGQIGPVVDRYAESPNLVSRLWPSEMQVPIGGWIAFRGP